MEPFREFIGSLSRMQAILMALESSSFKPDGWRETRKKVEFNTSPCDNDIEHFAFWHKEKRNVTTSNRSSVIPIERSRNLSRSLDQRPLISEKKPFSSWVRRQEKCWQKVSQKNPSIEIDPMGMKFFSLTTIYLRRRINK